MAARVERGFNGDLGPGLAQFRIRAAKLVAITRANAVNRVGRRALSPVSELPQKIGGPSRMQLWRIGKLSPPEPHITQSRHRLCAKGSGHVAARIEGQGPAQP